MMDTLKTYSVGIALGVKDSLLGIIALSSIDNDAKKTEGSRPPGRRGNRDDKSNQKKKAKVLPSFSHCCCLNGGILLVSVMVFERYVVPTVKILMTMIAGFFLTGIDPQSSLWSWMEPTMKYTFKYLWVVPLFWLCKILNVIWFVEIADAAYRRKFGRPVSSLLTSNESLFKVASKNLADFIFSICVEIFFLLQAQLVGLIPILGPPLSFVHMCLLYSLYAYEYMWSNFGWTVVRRLDYMENNWPYFIGYGVILTILTTLVTTSTVISACIFGITFPVFIISSFDGKPYEQCTRPIRIFSLAIWLTNKVFLIRSKKSKPEVHKQS